MDQRQLQDFYPCIQAVALARHATPDTLTTLIDQIRASGRERFRMYPPGDREEYVVTDYIHPTDWRNRRVLGFDLFSEATRREAIISTRNSGNPRSEEHTSELQSLMSISYAVFCLKE